jgi:uncharacterized protein (DUF433 family)
MTHDELMNRVIQDPTICGGRACIRGTRILVDIILDGLAEGLTEEQLIDHYPQLAVEDIRAAAAYGAELSRESVWQAGAPK